MIEIKFQESILRIYIRLSHDAHPSTFFFDDLRYSKPDIDGGASGVWGLGITEAETRLRESKAAALMKPRMLKAKGLCESKSLLTPE